jgi:hypothetical protein
MPKIKFLQSFISSIGTFEKDVVQEIELDDYTLNNWVENGLVEEVKEKKTVKKDANI